MCICALATFIDHGASMSNPEVFIGCTSSLTLVLKYRDISVRVDRVKAAKKWVAAQNGSILLLPFWDQHPPTIGVNLRLVNYYATHKDENIGNHGYIGNLILWIYRIYRWIFWKKKFNMLKLDQNSWKCKKNLIAM